MKTETEKTLSKVQGDTYGVYIGFGFLGIFTILFCIFGFICCYIQDLPIMACISIGIGGGILLGGIIVGFPIALLLMFLFDGIFIPIFRFFRGLFTT